MHIIFWILGFWMTIISPVLAQTQKMQDEFGKEVFPNIEDIWEEQVNEDGNANAIVKAVLISLKITSFSFGTITKKQSKSTIANNVPIKNPTT